MTAGQHEAAARSEEQTAAGHEAQHNPSATPETPRGPSPGAYAGCISYKSSNCYVRWGSEQNPTDEHRKEGEQHKKLAERHRAASKALVEAEHRFCSGIPEADRDLSPFYHREDITTVQLNRVAENFGYGEGPGSVDGARITFRAVPGMTPEWLQRVVDCHLARNAVIGDDPAMSFCPLAVPHATANVTSTGRGFAVDVISDDGASTKEIIKRASALGQTVATQ